MASVLAGMVGAIVCIAITGGPDVAAALFAGICLLAGFLGLGVTRDAGAPLRPARIALALSMPPAAYMLTGLPWPPSGPELVSFLVLALGLLLSGSAIALTPRRPRLAIGILVVLAAYGVFMLGRFGRYLVSAASDGGRIDPATTLAYVLAASVGTAWIAALFHARSLWRGNRSDHDRAT